MPEYIARLANDRGEVLKRVDRFTGGAEQHDDITTIAIRAE